MSGDAIARSSAAPQIVVVWCSLLAKLVIRTSYIRTKIMGERGHPCFTPLCTGILMCGARVGVSETFCNRLKAILRNQNGQFCFLSVA